MSESNAKKTSFISRLRGWRRDLFFIGQGVVAAFVLFVIANHTILEDERIRIQSQSGEFETTAAEVGQILNRVNTYEDALKERSHFLDSVLSEVGQLDLTSSEPEPKEALLESSTEGGVGGGDEPEHSSEVYRLSDESSFGRYAGLTLVDKLDFQIQQIKRLPVGYPIAGGRLSSGFGKRRSPFSRRWRMHHGVDLSAQWRTEVVATADGVVTYAGYKGAYGRMVKVDHGNGLSTVYGHLSRIHAKVGDRICRGERLGLLGSTGRSTGPHLHYEVRRDGDAVNPIPFLELASVMQLLS